MAVAPERLHDNGTVVRRFTIEDAATIARALRDNLDHVARWMPWATPTAADEAFQRVRLAPAIAHYDDDTADWEFAICSAAGEVIGACGILGRGNGRRIWYWVGENHGGQGHATRAARMLTEMWRTTRSEPRLEIRCDEANVASATIPRRLGYRFDATVRVRPETAAETGRMMVWVVDR